MYVMAQVSSVENCRNMILFNHYNSVKSSSTYEAYEYS